jgi:tripartite-type tricarboxylate transporter receptor subunit TctC
MFVTVNFLVTPAPVLGRLDSPEIETTARRDNPLRSAISLMVIAAALLFAPAIASAQTYPQRNISIVVPQPAGGLIDTVARIIQPHLQKALGKSVIIDNQPGGTGAIAIEAVARAVPDGHTLLVQAGGSSAAQTIGPGGTNELAAVVLLTKFPFVFVVNATLPAHNLPEFIMLAKKDPGKYNYATAGPTSLTRVAVEDLIRVSGIKMQHVPYRGGAKAMLAVVRGESHILAISPALALPQIRAGAVRAVAIGSLARDPRFPDLATVAEAGFPGFEAGSWIGMLAPAATPKLVIERLNSEVNRALLDPVTVTKFSKLGVFPVGGGVAVLQQMIASRPGSDANKPGAH